MNNTIRLAMAGTMLVSMLALSTMAMAIDTNRKIQDSTTLVRPPAGASPFDALNQKMESVKAEMAQVQKEQAEIDRQAEPLGNQLRAKLNELDAHNQQVDAHNAECEGQTGDDSFVNRCNSRADSLNAKGSQIVAERDRLVQILTGYKNQWDNLEQRRLNLQAQLDNMQKCQEGTDEQVSECMRSPFDTK